jgi:hypothetical protein
MKLTKVVIVTLLTPAIAALAGFGVHTYKVHYSVKGSAHDFIVQAESSSAARSEVRQMIPNAAVTGVSQVKP